MHGRPRPPKKRLTAKHSVKHVKYSPEEMAYDPGPEETERWPLVARGLDEWRRFFAFRRGFVRLEPELATFYGSAETVNRVLKKIMEADAAIRNRRRETA